MRRETVPAFLERSYECRDSEGGCGAERGERCKTFRLGHPTQPHQDRWRQWDLAGNPGAWWHKDPAPALDWGKPRTERSAPTVADFVKQLDRLERDLVDVSTMIAKLREAAAEPGS